MGQSTPIRPARAWPEPQSREEDELLLQCLQLRDHDRLTDGQILRELGLGITRNTLIGKLHRIDAADEAAHKRVL